MKTKEIKVKGKQYEAAEIDGGQLGALTALITDGDVDIEEKPGEVENAWENRKVYRVTWQGDRISGKVREAMGGYMPEIHTWGGLKSMYVIMKHTGEEAEVAEDKPESRKEVYTYYGMEEVWISDPSYLKEGKYDDFTMAKIKVVPGVWHCRQMIRRAGGRAYKVVMYAESCDSNRLAEVEEKASYVGTCGVDTGEIGVISRKYIEEEWTEGEGERIWDAVMKTGHCFDLTRGLFVTETENGDGSVRVSGWKMPSGRYKALFLYLP